MFTTLLEVLCIKKIYTYIALSADAVEYADYTSAVG